MSFYNSFKRKYSNMFWKQYLIAAIGFSIFVITLML